MNINNKFFHPVLMKNYTWIKIGGEALMAKVQNIDELLKLLKYINQSEYNVKKYVVVGSGSNIICNSKKLNSLIIRLGRGFNYVKISEENSKDKLIVGASTTGFNLAKKALDLGITGLQFTIGIPGTIGGMCAMNAGSYGVEICDHIKSIKFITKDGKIISKTRDELNFSYRKCDIPEDWIIIECSFNVEYGDKNKIKSELQKIMHDRSVSQPVKENTCGSTFMNTEKFPAWKLIKDSGMHEKQIGDIMFSDMHHNFLINKGNATSDEVLMLIRQTKDKIKRMFDIDLELEVKLIDC
ncbi:UDP-N-acetylmuramate dehydrogenase [Anaplasmataceae bacterium AB001_6]|nr:UDP-N-acetylmuramate dehydrogenase [Anaplasmataceae bacterium AB001_6]